MSISSQAREVARIERINSKTPDWARDQIARQHRFFEARKAYAESKECTVERFSARAAFAAAMATLGVIFTAKEKRPHLSKLELRTKA